LQARSVVPFGELGTDFQPRSSQRGAEDEDRGRHEKIVQGSGGKTLEHKTQTPARTGTLAFDF
jgi:hypothetical protein